VSARPDESLTVESKPFVYVSAVIYPMRSFYLINYPTVVVVGTVNVSFV